MEQGAGDGAEVDRGSEAVAEFRQGGIGLRPDEFKQASVGSGIEFALRYTSVRLGLNGARVAVALKESDDAGEADGEQVRELTQGVFAPIHGSDDALSEVVGVRTHGHTSSWPPLPVL